MRDGPGHPGGRTRPGICSLAGLAEDLHNALNQANGGVQQVGTTSQGQTAQTLLTTWQGTQTDGDHAHDGLSGTASHLATLSGQLSEQLPAITAGMQAIATIQAQGGKVLVGMRDVFAGQLADLTTALNNIGLAFDGAAALINTVSGNFPSACVTGFTPGEPPPLFAADAFDPSAPYGKANMTHESGGGEGSSAAETPTSDEEILKAGEWETALSRIKGLQLDQWSKLILTERLAVLRRVNGEISRIYGFTLPTSKEQIELFDHLVLQEDPTALPTVLLQEAESAYQLYRARIIAAGQRIASAIGSQEEAELLTMFAEENNANLYDVAALTEEGINPDTIAQWLGEGKNINGAESIFKQGLPTEQVGQWMGQGLNLDGVNTLLNKGISVEAINRGLSRADAKGWANVIKQPGLKGNIADALKNWGNGTRGFSDDGMPFQNREGLLPSENGPFTKYRVSNRGVSLASTETFGDKLRMVVDRFGNAYYFDDHYQANGRCLPIPWSFIIQSLGQ